MYLHSNLEPNIKIERAQAPYSHEKTLLDKILVKITKIAYKGKYAYKKDMVFIPCLLSTIFQILNK